jgi:thiamine biosynthesis lipoprotein ApbE
MTVQRLSRCEFLEITALADGLATAITVMGKAGLQVIEQVAGRVSKTIERS